MKKLKFYTLYILISLVTLTQESFANSDGYYMDLSLSSNDVSHDVVINIITANQSNRTLNISGAASPSKANVSDNNNGFSVKIGKKITISDSNFFVAPSISYDYINNSTRDTNNFEYKIKDRIITDLSLGYDINNRFSTYLSYGVSDVGYQISADTNTNYANSVGLGSSANNLGKYKNRDSSEIYGIGVKYKADDNLYILVEYSEQKLDLYSEHDSLTGGLTIVKSESDIRSIKLGISKNL